MKKTSRICPRCNSRNVSTDSSNPLVGAVGMPAQYVCGDCNYTNVVFPEINIEDVKELKVKSLSKDTKTEKIDVSYGLFLGKVFWKFTSPITFISSLILFWISFTYRNVFLISIILFVISLFMIYFAYIKKYPQK